MRKRFGFACVLATALLIGRGAISCDAQGQSPVSFRIDTDMRSRFATAGQSRSGLFKSTVRLDARLSPNWRLHYAGGQTNAPNLTGTGDPMRFDRFITQEATLETEWKNQRLQLGIVRLPFGLYDHRETYASGLIDWPLARVDYQFLALDHGTPGAVWTGGTPNLQVEASLFGGQSSGVWNDLTELGGTAFRLQTYRGNLILGLSRWDGFRKTIPPGLVNGQRFGVHMNGIDLRYTLPHLMIRGEYLFGETGGSTMRGWYLDAYYRLPKYEKITLTARLEEFQPNTVQSLLKQVTFGVRYTLDSQWILALNWRRNSGQKYNATWTPATGGNGDFFLQAYHKIPF